MKYLLIDFGATYIKCAFYHKGIITPATNYTSPFKSVDRISRSELLDVLTNVVVDHGTVDGIVICTILGGKWEGDLYKSWKCLEPNDKGAACLISGLFESIAVHSDHLEFTTAICYTDALDVIGRLNNIPVYTGLGDTNCVIRSLNIPTNGVAINMGTGSQVITNTKVLRFFPAGRSFLVFNSLFEFSSKSIFDIMQELTVEDVEHSSLAVDLAVFEQACTWRGGGAITNITESNFNLSNLTASLLKAFVNQYRDAIGDAKTIILVGGIADKVNILPDLFRSYYPDKKVVYERSNIEATHQGLAYMINKYLPQ